MSEPFAIPNETQGVLASDFVLGTDNHCHLVAIGLFDAGGGHNRIQTTDGAHWCLITYTGVSTNDLTGITQVGLSGQLCSTGDDAYTFPTGSYVYRVCMGEDVSKRIMGPASATDGNLFAADGVTGKLAKDSGIPMTAVTQIEAANRTIYVDADDGDDVTGDGSIGTPYETYSKALSTVKDVIANGVTVTIHLVAATASYTLVDTGRVCIGSGTLAIQGDLTQLETATADSGDATTLTDSGAFSGDSYAGKLVHIISGTGEGQYRVIRTHTNDVLTVVGRFNTSPASDSVYEILGWGTLVTASASVTFTQGTVTITDIGCTTFSTSFLCGTGYATMTVTQCSFIASSGIAILCGPAGPCTITLNTVSVDGNAQTGKLCYSDAAGTNFVVQRTWCHGFTSSMPCLDFGGSGARLRIGWGSYLDGTAGSSIVAKVHRCAFAYWYSPTVNGGVDVTTVLGDAGNTYGIYCDTNGISVLSTSTYVTLTGSYSVAASGANAAAMAYCES